MRQYQSPIDNYFLDGFFRTSDNIFISGHQWSQIFKTIFDDMKANPDEYYSGIEDVELNELVISVLSKYNENPEELFISWLKKICINKNVKNPKDIVGILSLIYPTKTIAEIYLDLLNPSSPLQVFDGNVKTIDELDINDKLAENIREFQMYFAEGTINNLSDFAIGEIENLSDYDSELNIGSILSKKYNVENAKLIESIHAKFKNVADENEFNWEDIIPELILYGDYTSTIDNFSISFNDIFEGEELNFVNKYKSLFEEYDWLTLDYAQKIEKNKQLDLYNIF